MRRFFCAAICLLATAGMWAQGWTNKVKKSVVMVTTYDANGNILGTTNGFFVTDDGEAVSGFAPFKGAARATVADASGKAYPVTLLLGVSDIYDVVRFKVDDAKAPGLKRAKSAAAVGDKLYALHYSTSHVNPRDGAVTKAETFRDTYKYYTFGAKTVERSSGCPVLNKDGEAVAILQGDGGEEAYALDLQFALDQQMSALSGNDPTLREIGITKDLPADYTQAQVALFMAANSGEANYRNTIDRFLQLFPTKADGYKARADLHFMHDDFAAAEADLLTAEKYSDDKADIHSHLARMIFNKNAYKADKDYPSWTMDKALQECVTAYSISPQPLYLYQKAEVLFSMEKYRESVMAFNEYEEKMEGKVDHQFHFGRYQAEVQSKIFPQALADIDSAIVKAPANPLYRAEKANLQYRLGLFDEAIATAQDCLSQYGDYSDCFLIMGLCQIRKNQKSEGLANLRRADALGNPQAAALIEKYK